MKIVRTEKEALEYFSSRRKEQIMAYNVFRMRTRVITTYEEARKFFKGTPARL